MNHSTQLTQTNMFPSATFPSAAGDLYPPLAAGLAARNAGAARVLANTDDGWTANIIDVVRDLTRTLPELTADDVRAEALRRGIPEPHHPNAYGAALLNAAHAGLIVGTGRSVRSERRAARGRQLAVWAPKRSGGAA